MKNSNTLRRLIKSDGIADWEYESLKKAQRKEDRVKRSARGNKRVWVEPVEESNESNDR